MSRQDEKILFAACIVEQALISLMQNRMWEIDKKKANNVVKIVKGREIWHFSCLSFLVQQFTSHKCDDLIDKKHFQHHWKPKKCKNRWSAIFCIHKNKDLNDNSQRYEPLGPRCFQSLMAYAGWYKCKTMSRWPFGGSNVVHLHTSPTLRAGIEIC